MYAKQNSPLDLISLIQISALHSLLLHANTNIFVRFYLSFEDKIQ